MSASADKDLEDQLDMTETEPLGEAQGDAGIADYGSADNGTGGKKTPLPQILYEGLMFHGHISKDSVQDSMTYHMEDLASWNSVFHMSFSVWHRKSLWGIVAKLMLLSLTVSLLLLACHPNPHSLKAARFSKIGQFLRVFVGLLLGFFMSASVQRWWSCATSFQNLLAAVRTLHVYLEGLGVPEEHIRNCLSYGVSSAWMLHMQLHVEALEPEEQEVAVKTAWNLFTTSSHDELSRLKDEEIEDLRTAADPAGVLWMWIGSMIGFLAQEGEIPLLSSPTYGRIMGVVSDGLNAIRDVRASISMQAPYIYVQMLASLVHVNNIVNAISFGLTSGACVGSLLLHYGVHISNKADVSQAETVVDVQSLVLSFFFNCFGPVVYQALLEVSVAIAQPFSNKDAVIPTHRMIRCLVRDLHDSIRLAGKVSWQRPQFKKPAS